MAERPSKPILVVDIECFDAAKNVVPMVCRWLADEGIHVLNVAGPGANKEPAIYCAVRAILLGVLNASFAINSPCVKGAFTPWRCLTESHCITSCLISSLCNTRTCLHPGMEFALP